MSKVDKHKAHFRQVQEEDRRLCILFFLMDASAHRANNFVLQKALALRGHEVGREQVREDMYFLAGKELVTIEEYEGIVACTLTARGQDVATGATVVDGVQQPIGV